MKTDRPSGPLADLARRRSARRHRASTWDRSGGNRDFVEVEPGGHETLLDTTGAGCVTHLWFTIASDDPAALGRVILRCWWDTGETPCVEAPLGDLFGVGFGQTREFASLPLSTGPRDGRSLNCFWPMPFASGARVEVANEGTTGLVLYAYVDYERYETLADDLLRFHAQSRSSPQLTGATDPGDDERAIRDLQMAGNNLDGRDNVVVLEAEGAGQYVGCVLSVANAFAGRTWNWYGEGDDMIFVDGRAGEIRAGDPPGRPESIPGANDAWPPTLHGTGLEDYFGAAWSPDTPFAAPFHGLTLTGEGPDWDGRHTWYRFHVTDPVTFEERIRVTVERGHADRRPDEYRSVAFWYQSDPHVPFPPLELPPRPEP